MQTEVAKQLASKGISPKKADGIAEAIVARINGQELNRTQRNVLSSALGSSAVRDTISDLLQAKSNVVDSEQNRVYDESDLGNGFENKAETASWSQEKQSVDGNQENIQKQTQADAGENFGGWGALREKDGTPYEAVPSEQQREVISNTDVFGDGYLEAERVLSNGQLLRDMSELYAEKVNSNSRWRWQDFFPGSKKLTKGEKVAIKRFAINQALIPDVPAKVVKATNQNTLRYVDFDVAGLVKEKVDLPEHLWTETDAVQFKWLDEKIGGRPQGYTWHHSEKAGRMELVPTGIHNVYHHNGGRTKKHWAYREGGR